MLVGYLANNVLPARLGELVRSHYLGDREGISRSATLGTVVVERIVDTVVLVGIGAAGDPRPQRARRRGQRHPRGRGACRTARGGAWPLPLPLTGCRGPSASAAFLGRWPRVKGVVRRLRDGLRVAALPKTVALASVLSVAAWGCTVVAVLAVGQSLGIELTVGQGALLAAGTNLATAIPSGPGYLGTFEYAGQTIALAFGFPASKGLALAVLIHALTLLVTSIGGAVAILRLGWKRRTPVLEPHDEPALEAPAAPGS